MSIFKSLQDKNLHPIIPTCCQLEQENEQTLTTQQANESRRVTKCRFIIEKKIGEIKKFYALDRRRNTEVGRLQIDYRIACAMVNFTHKPCRSDESFLKKKERKDGRADLIAWRILDKYYNPKDNILEPLLQLRLGTLNIPFVEMTDIQDFPKLSKNVLRLEVFYGSYYLEQCKSYLSDLIKNGKIFRIKEDTSFHLIDDMGFAQRVKYELKASSIIAVEIVSRHKRSLKKSNDVKKDTHGRKFSFFI
jgi:hypothetical protein